MADTATAPRMARCPMCKTEVPSSQRHRLAFFEDRSAGHTDNDCRHCHYTREGHARLDADDRWPRNITPHPFTPRTEGYPVDWFYCGCRGWD